VDRLFLDANVLFSAAYREDSGLRRLWELEDVELVTSIYALEEARRNLDTDERLERLHELVRALKLVPESAVELPHHVELSEKDIPILQSALAAEASHLITGDRRDFGRYFGKEIRGVWIMTPRQYLASSRKA
jgi:predicted nucleic acid-binding protein